MKKTKNLVILIVVMLCTSCATLIKTPTTRFYYPTYKQWKSLNKQEMKIVNDFTFKNNYIAPEYRHLKTIKFNKNGRNKLKKIYLNR
jgi:outer membrane biogenesis lipoprotein LolB